MKNLMILASGRGTDFQAILDHEKLGVLQDSRISCVVCNHDGARVIERAKSAGVRVFVVEGVTGRKFRSHDERELQRSKFDEECLKIAGDQSIDTVILAGFDQIVSRKFVESLKFKILNIHPAYDLKQFGGKNMVGLKVHEAVIRSGCTYSGCTVHFVTPDLDMGPPILKKKVRLESGENAESLERKVLALEHLTYPEAIQLIVDERVVVNKEGTMCFVDRFSNGWDVGWEMRQRSYILANPEEGKILGL